MRDKKITEYLAKIKKLSLSTKQFMIFYMVIVILLTGFLFFRMKQIQDEMEENAQKSLYEKLDRAVSALDTCDEGVKKMLQYMMKGEGVFTYEEEKAEAYLRDIKEIETFIQNAFICMQDGTVYSDKQTMYRVYGGREIKDTIQMSHQKLGMIHYSSPYYSRMCAANTVCMAFTSPEDMRSAAVELNLNALYLEMKAHIGSGISCFFVTSQDNKIILFDKNAGSDFVKSGVFPMQMRDEYMDIIEKKDIKAFTPYQIEGTKFQAIYSDKNNLHWKVFLVFDDANIKNSEILQIWKLNLYVIGALAVLGIVVFKITFWFTKPVRQLGEKMEQVKSLTDMEVFPVEREDEIGKLYHSYNRLIETIQKLITDLKDTEQKKRRHEIAALQNQIGPHFLHNTLVCIICLLRQEQTEKAEESLNALISLLAYNFRGSQDTVTIHAEMQMLKDYICLQKMRYGDIFQMKILVDPKAEACNIPKLMIQPIVENAIFHGIMSSEEEDGEIRIEIKTNGDEIQVCVSDNGSGMTQAQIDSLLSGEKEIGNNSRMSGIGVSNVNERLHLIYGERYGIEIQSHRGTMVILTFPWKV